MKRGRRAPVWLASITAVLAATSGRAAGVVGNGTPASCTEAALAAALAGGGLVTFDCGTAPVTIPVTAEHVITSATTLDGADRVALDGQNATRLFRVPDAAAPLAVVFRDVDLVGGRCPTTGPGAGAGGAVWAGANAHVELRSSRPFGNRCGTTGAEIGGGAVYVQNGSLLLSEIEGALNGATSGGTVHAVDSAVTIEDSVFVAVPSGLRGGGVFASGGSLTVRRSAILASPASGGGAGMYVVGSGDAIVEDSLVQSGDATGGLGGAIYRQGGTLTVARSTFGNNRADEGGALYVIGSQVSITNTTFRQNRAVSGRGGALKLALPVSGTVAHSTFVGNRASLRGGAISSDAVTLALAPVLRASIVEDNAEGTGPTLSSACDGTLAPGGFNFQSPGETADVPCTADVTRISSQLGPFEQPSGVLVGVFPLQPTSPARDAVTAGCPPPATDARGIARPFGPACDAGAAEFAPVLTIDDPTTVEGTGGTTPVAFTVRVSLPSDQTITVAYETQNGTAVAPADYASTSGVLTFPPGDTERTVTVALVADAIVEPDETFRLQLHDAVNAAGSPSGTATIDDDDVTPPVLNVSDCTADEGAAPDVFCRFVVTASAPSGFPMQFGFATVPGTATSGADYESLFGAATLPTGATQAFVDVRILDDAEDEVPETLSLLLSDPQNATVGDGVGEGVIVDDDPTLVTAGGAAVVEGDAGTTPLALPLTLSAPSSEAVVVQYAPVSASGTAIAGVDYVAATGTVTFPPGSVSQPAVVGVLGDGLDEPNERFVVALDALAGGVMATGSERVVATVLDDDGGTFALRDLEHGAAFRSDLSDGADFYVVAAKEHASWEVLVDEGSGDLGARVGPALERVGLDLQTVLQSSVPIGVGPARSLRLRTSGPVDVDQYVRVSSASCGSDCGPDDTYRIRAYETTLRATRYNCTGGQASVMVLQNRGAVTVSATVLGFAPSGQPSGGQTSEIGPRATQVLPLCTVLAGSGSLIVVNDGAYDQLAGKVVAVEPATGFAFDTPLEPRRR